MYAQGKQFLNMKTLLLEATGNDIQPTDKDTNMCKHFHFLFPYLMFLKGMLQRNEDRMLYSPSFETLRILQSSLEALGVSSETKSVSAINSNCT